ncbi:MAG: HNH endonuclease [SAR324 cluster bacterium]|nr:HNH endonuclease [SAR324 cluster bacterium]
MRTILSAAARKAVQERDHGACRNCGLDTYRIVRIIRSALAHYRSMGGDLWWDGGTDILEAIGWIPDLDRTPFDTDHVRPVALGGEDVMENLQTLCQPCHRDRSAKLHRQVTGLPETDSPHIRTERKPPRLISRYRLLDEKTVDEKMRLPSSNLVVNVVQARLRGVSYRVILRGHHALAAARRRGIEPNWMGPNPEFQEYLRGREPSSVEYFFLHIFGHSGWFFVDTGLPVRRLLVRD